jgi:hypothetical protein
MLISASARSWQNCLSRRFSPKHLFRTFTTKYCRVNTKSAYYRSLTIKYKRLLSTELWCVQFHNAVAYISSFQGVDSLLVYVES